MVWALLPPEPLLTLWFVELRRDFCADTEFHQQTFTCWLVYLRESECLCFSLSLCVCVVHGCDKACVADTWEVWILHIKRTPAPVHTINLLPAATGVLQEHTLVRTPLRPLRTPISINRRTHEHVQTLSYPSNHPPTNHLIQRLHHRHTHTHTRLRFNPIADASQFN